MIKSVAFTRSQDNTPIIQVLVDDDRVEYKNLNRSELYWLVTKGLQMLAEDEDP